jgi:hypothetical protein
MTTAKPERATRTGTRAAADPLVKIDAHPQPWLECRGSEGAEEDPWSSHETTD